MFNFIKKNKLYRYLGIVIILGSFFFGGIFFGVARVSAQVNPQYDPNNPNAQQRYVYPLHEKIPGQNGRAGQGSRGIDTLQEYLESLYKFGIAIVAILAVVMIGIGAFMYIVTSAGNAGKLANAKEIITNAIVGLVMALLAWLILFIINPDLVGTTLTTPTLESNNYIDDGQPDAMCAGLGNSYAEVTNCNDDNICFNGQCRSKRRICEENGGATVLNFECDNSGVAQPEQPCGMITSSGDNFLGTCTSPGIKKCSPSETLVSKGKQCGNSVCCMSK